MLSSDSTFRSHSISTLCNVKEVILSFTIISFVLRSLIGLDEYRFELGWVY